MHDRLAGGGIEVLTVILRPSLDLCLSRAKERDNRPLQNAAVVESLWHDFDQLGDLERHVIDNSFQQPEETAGLVADRLRSSGSDQPSMLDDP